MIDEKCKHCSALVIPYFGIFRKPQSELPEDLKEGTCRCNVDVNDRLDEGYYGWCHPDLCRGPEHKYIFDYNTPNRDLDDLIDQEEHDKFKITVTIEPL